ncbi:helix-turn-helix transcriptional regulator [Thalassomonas viridans]|uniref:Helix-turn-helix transcriptional regulator n=1 Tax=Thalassomonas viridans TaxID=137584 RepID=A0AAE9ZEQ5_9GAMM|nr:metalloregulator ArsR/SmtB family transcription factor [Thalassomonas viridans]WDE08867.1 helix-turn-helix transcriptional regulator [Thalassomonas viridans]
MEIEVIAKALKELGHPKRLSIFKRLVKCGFQGLTVGQLQKELNIPGSTLSHHISSLVSADLVKQRREGTTLYCVANYKQLTQVTSFLQEECCFDDELSEEQHSLS